MATIGPSISSKEGLKKAIESGMNVARLNFSHGTHQEHQQVLHHLKDLIRELSTPVAILQDLQGPKIRVGKFKNGSVELIVGQKVVISPDFKVGDGNEISTEFVELPRSVQPGMNILLDDGLMQLRVLSVQGNQVEAEVIHGGVLKNRKGMNLPGAQLPVEGLTEKDKIDLEFGLDNHVDYVALSFVRHGDDIRKLRRLIEEKKSSGTKIVAKIEMFEALRHLEEIISLSDAVMVARGDLAVEVGQSQLPGLQKKIIALSNRLHRPVITATQMLDSMVENPRPTRAEITDVANAVIDGSDALMLSAESASGQHPFACLRTMHEIIYEVEKTTDLYYDISLSNDENLDVAEAIAVSACVTALKVNAKAIVCFTTTGRTATLISHYRPQAKIVAVTHVHEVLNRLELPWGLMTFGIRPYQSTEEAWAQVEELLLGLEVVQNGDKVVITMGWPVSERAKTNSIRVVEIKKNRTEFIPKTVPVRCRNLGSEI